MQYKLLLPPRGNGCFERSSTWPEVTELVSGGARARIQVAWAPNPGATLLPRESLHTQSVWSGCPPAGMAA